MYKVLLQSVIGKWVKFYINGIIPQFNTLEIFTSSLNGAFTTKVLLTEKEASKSVAKCRIDNIVAEHHPRSTTGEKRDRSVIYLQSNRNSDRNVSYRA